MAISRTAMEVKDSWNDNYENAVELDKLLIYLDIKQ